MTRGTPHSLFEMTLRSFVAALVAACWLPAGCDRAPARSTPVDTTAITAAPVAAMPVDTVLARHVDVDGDEQPDTVRLRITAPAFDKPFTYVLTIDAGGREILRREVTHDDMDADFADATFTSPCAGYERCKREWYFRDLLAGVVRTSSMLGEAVYDSTVGYGIHGLATSHLVAKCGATRDRAIEAVRRVIPRMQEGRVPVYLEDFTPMSLGSPHVWFPEFSCFAPVYGE